MDRVVRGTRARIASVVDKLAQGQITELEFADHIGALLGDRHARAAVLGRQRAGDSGGRDRDDDVFGAIVAEGEIQFLLRFSQQIADGKYRDANGVLDAAKVARRAESYAERLTGTANETFGLVSPGLLYWRLGPVKEEHCYDCPDLAMSSPWTAADIPTYPHKNETECLYQCKCHIERADGLAGFSATARE